MSDAEQRGDFWGEEPSLWAPDLLRGLEFLLTCDRVGLVGVAFSGEESSLLATGWSGLGEEVWQWSCDMLEDEEEAWSRSCDMEEEM